MMRLLKRVKEILQILLRLRGELCFLYAEYGSFQRIQAMKTGRIVHGLDF